MPIHLFFNKTTITVIGVCLLCLSVHFTTKKYYTARYNEEITQIKLQHQEQVLTSKEQHSNEINALNNKIQTTQTQLTEKTRELNHVLKQKQSATIDGIKSGTIRLRDKHATDTNACTTSNNKTDSNSAVRQSDNRISSGRELSRQTSEDLIRLATDAEQTNIALKSCIQQYNNIKEKLNEQGSN